LGSQVWIKPKVSILLRPEIGSLYNSLYNRVVPHRPTDHQTAQESFAFSISLAFAIRFWISLPISMKIENILAALRGWVRSSESSSIRSAMPVMYSVCIVRYPRHKLLVGKPPEPGARALARTAVRYEHTLWNRYRPTFTIGLLGGTLPCSKPIQVEKSVIPLTGNKLQSRRLFSRLSATYCLLRLLPGTLKTGNSQSGNYF
jgi:hypothetical protein